MHPRRLWCVPRRSSTSNLRQISHSCLLGLQTVIKGYLGTWTLIIKSLALVRAALDISLACD